MLSLKLLRQTLTDPRLLLPHHPHPTTTTTHQHPTTPPSNPRSDKTLVVVLVFTPTNEVVVDTYRLASIARDIGLNLHPTPSLSHVVFSSSSTSSDPTVAPFSSSLCLHDAVPLPFPSLSSASVFHLQAFASLAIRYFKLVRISGDNPLLDTELASDWERSGMSLIARQSSVKIETMDRFSWAMAGAGWTLFKTKSELNSSTTVPYKGSVVYLYRKVETNRLSIEGRRVREVRLPLLDFKNAPLRILHYIILMTGDVFYMSS